MENRLEKMMDLENVANFSLFMAAVGVMMFFDTGRNEALKITGGASLMFIGGFILYYRRNKLADSNQKDGEEE